MSGSVCFSCRRPTGNRAFCQDCRRALTDDEHWALRMAYHAPAFGRSDEKGVEGLSQIWGGSREQLWIWEGNQGAAFRGAMTIADNMASVEYLMVLRAVGRAVYRRLDAKRIRARAKARLADRKAAKRASYESAAMASA